MGVAYLVGYLSRLNYNSWYGGASKDLVKTAVTEIEEGNIDRVMSGLRRLSRDYRPTYENRAHYDELVNAAVAEMKGHDTPGGQRAATPFTRETWVGHWEDDRGFWLVINQSGAFDIVRSGHGMPRMTNVVISDDSATLTFDEGDRWRHELTLRNKYEATHVWRDRADGRVWQTNALHKLRRATPEQRAFTEQGKGTRPVESP